MTASGQIKPKTIVNVGANAMGRIVRLFVKEGEKVKKNQILAQLENVQSAADVAMTRATVSSARPTPLPLKPRSTPRRHS